MQIQSIVHWKDKTLTLYCICLISLILFISGCGEDYSFTNDDNDTGSYACSIKWPEDVPILEATSTVSRAIVCSDAGISKVRFSFYNGSGDYLTGKRFDCSEHSGTVSGIPAGNNIRLIVTGEDSSENVLYQGERTGITIVAGQTIDDSGNPIQMERVVPPDIPISVSATAGDGQITISWDDVLNATSYNIYWSTSSGVTIATGTKISNVTGPYTHTGRTNGTTYYYVVTAENSYGESANSNEVNAIPIGLSITITGSATSVTSNSATLNGTINPNGDSTTYYFEYGTTSSYGTTTTSASAGSGTSAVSVNADISSLNPKTTYHYRVVATNSVGTTYGDDQSFTTIDVPDATTESATLVTSNSATLNGTVNPNGDSTTYYFEYGTTTSYGTPTTSTSAGSGTSAVSVSADISSLNPNTTYHFRVVATNSVGTTYGADQSFTTLVNTPTNVRASSGDEKVTIFWDDVSSATSYNIYWTTYTGVSKIDYEGLISDATSPYAHMGLANDTTYYYIITAENTYGESADSNEVNATPVHALMDNA